MSKLKQLLNKLATTGFAHLFGSSVINKVLGMLCTIVLVRLIPKSDYGIYAYANNILGLFCIFEGLGMITALLQYGCTTKGEEKQQVWSFCFYTSLLFQFVCSVIIILLSVFANFAIDGTSHVLLLLAFLPFVRTIRNMQNVYWRTELKMKEFAISNNFNTIITVCLSIILSFLFKLHGLIIATYAALIISSLFCLKFQHLPFPKIKLGLPKGKRIEIIRFGIVSALVSSVTLVIYQLDTFFLGTLLGDSAITASYKVALTIPTAFAFIPMCVMTYIYPYFAKNNQNKQWCISHIKQVYLYFGSVNAIICILAIIFAPSIAIILFGEQYLDAVATMRLLFINYFISSTFQTVSGQLLTTINKLNFNLVLAVIVCILNIGLNLILIPRFLAIGAACATIVSSCISGLCSTIYLLHNYQKA